MYNKTYDLHDPLIDRIQYNFPNSRWTGSIINKMAKQSTLFRAIIIVSMTVWM